MSNPQQSNEPEQQSNEPEHFTEPAADDMPSENEARAAERGADMVDVDEVRSHAEEMNRRGANVEGEGEIEPD